MAKVKRNLSGIYFFSINPETNEKETRVFEDLSEEEQDKILSNAINEEWVRSLCKRLANTINEIGDQLDLMAH